MQNRGCGFSVFKSERFLKSANTTRQKLYSKLEIEVKALKAPIALFPLSYGTLYLFPQGESIGKNLKVLDHDIKIDTILLQIKSSKVNCDVYGILTFSVLQKLKLSRSEIDYFK